MWWTWIYTSQEAYCCCCCCCVLFAVIIVDNFFYFVCANLFNKLLYRTTRNKNIKFTPFFFFFMSDNHWLTQQQPINQSINNNNIMVINHVILILIYWTRKKRKNFHIFRINKKKNNLHGSIWRRYQNKKKMKGKFSLFCCCRTWCFIMHCMPCYYMKEKIINIWPIRNN